MHTVITIIIGVLLFSGIIVFHEFGHFIVAKKNGIKVEEFMIGLGPKIFSFKKGETVFAFRLFLIGGACQMLGEDAVCEDERAFCNKGPWARFATVFAGPLFNFILAFVFAAIVIAILGFDKPAVTGVNERTPVLIHRDLIKGYHDPLIVDLRKNSPASTTVFYNVNDPSDYVVGMKKGDLIKKYEGKSYTLSRELTYHFVLDRMTADPFEVEFERDGKVYRGTITPQVTRKYNLGFSYSADNNPCKISEVTDGGVMDTAGIRSGDIIKSINGVTVATGKAISDYFDKHPLDENMVVLVVEHKGTDYTYNLIPSYSESCISPRFSDNSVGITFNHNATRVDANPIQVIGYAFYEVKFQIVNTFHALGKLVTGQLSLKNNVGGPVRVVSELGNTIEESKEDGLLYIILNLLNYAILLSANLGVMNLLPLPALDGGRLIFIIIELIRRKPVPKEKEGLVHAIGMIFLLALMVLVLFNDIRYVFF